MHSNRSSRNWGNSSSSFGMLAWLLPLLRRLPYMRLLLLCVAWTWFCLLFPCMLTKIQPSLLLLLLLL
jgi:hypothetical protein